MPLPQLACFACSKVEKVLLIRNSVISFFLYPLTAVTIFWLLLSSILSLSLLYTVFPFPFTLKIEWKKTAEGKEWALAGHCHGGCYIGLRDDLIGRAKWTNMRFIVNWVEGQWEERKASPRDINTLGYGDSHVSVIIGSTKLEFQYFLGLYLSE